MDYQALNNLLTQVTKAHYQAKGVLTLVPLPKMHEMYTKLAGSHIYSTLDMTSGYYHIALSEDSQRKSAFVTPMGKFKLKFKFRESSFWTGSSSCLIPAPN